MVHVTPRVEESLAPRRGSSFKFRLVPFIDLAQSLDATAEGRPRDGVDHVARYVAGVEPQLTRVGHERRRSYAVDARRLVLQKYPFSNTMVFNRGKCRAHVSAGLSAPDPPGDPLPMYEKSTTSRLGQATPIATIVLWGAHVPRAMQTS